ncbi:putative serine/threonine-protein kinase PBL21 [Carex rostrata]
MSTTLAAAIAGAAGVVLLLIVLFVALWFFALRRRGRRSNSPSSETVSSDPSVQAGRGVELVLTGGSSELSGPRRVSIEELNAATKNFSSINLIGHGAFGEVYKGLLHDGTVVAIKRRPSAPNEAFVQEVHHLSLIRHRNLVSLLGYCQEDNLQMLVYEYVPNGSVSTHLYGAGQVSSRKLEFKHRLSIAYGTAKGLSHLHSLNPPLVHMNFKTSNVLVDEDFIPKVADAGLRILLDRIGGSSETSSSYKEAVSDNPFLDPEVKESAIYTIQSDVYSFGVFLIELASGREARADQSIIQLMQRHPESGDIATIVDPRMSGNFTMEGMGEFMRLISWCVNQSSERRPPMHYVEMEIERIREKEMSLTTIMGEGATVTLGSQLFTSSKVK